MAVSYKLVEKTEAFLFLETVFKFEGRPRKEGTPVSVTVKDICKSVFIYISVNSIYIIFIFSTKKLVTPEWS